MKRNILLLSVAIAAIIVLLSWYAASKQTDYTDFVMGSVLTQTYWTNWPSFEVLEAIKQLEEELL
ncbi:MAG: hypothetical protein FWE89_05470, partial [Syntrophaceae bacterium]|nr:hypothetical protein [Syntrophaceae bacterium]